MLRVLELGVVGAAALVGLFLAVALWIQFLWNGLAADVFSAPTLDFFDSLIAVAAIITVRLFTRVTVIRVKR